ncbi:hypothetical protein E2C01_064230 [Portunus trituberculatus]|uniref:Uncharacterized protein n=1 Tax=Portunus trituberculatus TaxID=210409 RepID=A0A5B7HJ72_PORTR|nr:hypothetical protein [Portunus trituberculatus]
MKKKKKTELRFTPHTSWVQNPLPYTPTYTRSHYSPLTPDDPSHAHTNPLTPSPTHTATLQSVSCNNARRLIH